MNNKKIRKDVIKEKLGSIIDTLEVIRENLPDDFEDFYKSRILKDAVYKEIEFCIESILDICSIINTDLKLGVPELEDSILDNIEKKKIFEKKAVELIKEMKKFRNILVHKYGNVNDEQAFENIKDGLDNFDAIIEEFERFLDKH